MGNTCCAHQSEPSLQSFDHLMYLVSPIINGQTPPQPGKGPHQPNTSFATIYTQQIVVPKPIENRMEDLGMFQFQTGLSVPRGKFLSPYIMKNGAIYVGEWKKGKLHGRGLYILPNTTLLYCLTQNHNISGKGRVLYPNGDYYEGDLVEGKANGKGKYVEGNTFYTGFFKDNVRDGEGVQVGGQYQFEGVFNKGKKIYGKLIWRDQQHEKYQFTGQLVANKFEGKGSVVSSDGKYTGQFKRGLKSGKGRFLYANKRYYEGSFEEGLRNGEGSIVDQIEGERMYHGKWHNDIMIDS